MALGTRTSPTEALVTSGRWVRRHGDAVGEMHGFSPTVHPVHARNSWHDDQASSFGKAADINRDDGDERLRSSPPSTAPRSWVSR